MTTTNSAQFSFVRVSGNRKTGPIPVTNSAPVTCPDSCALKGAGCYAEHGPVYWHWRKRLALSLAELCRLIRTIPGGSLWRHNVAGDLPGNGETIDAAALHKIARANRGRRGFTYTHKPATRTISQQYAKRMRSVLLSIFRPITRPPPIAWPGTICRLLWSSRQTPTRYRERRAAERLSYALPSHPTALHAPLAACARSLIARILSDSSRKASDANMLTN